jgi:toxin ParE1/3/4
MKIVVSQAAANDLLQIYSYLAEYNEGAAEAILGRIDRKFEELARFPFIGRERTALAPGLRSALVGVHLIFHTVADDRITIVRVMDGRRDIDQEFQR